MEIENKNFDGSSRIQRGICETKEVFYRIQLTVAVYKNKKLAYKKEMIVPTWYTRRSEARAHIKQDIEKRLKESDFFISPRVDYDLVRYSMEGSCNTYIRYRIIEEEEDILKLNEFTFDK